MVMMLICCATMCVLCAAGVCASRAWALSSPCADAEFLWLRYGAVRRGLMLVLHACGAVQRYAVLCLVLHRWLDPPTHRLAIDPVRADRGRARCMHGMA